MRYIIDMSPDTDTHIRRLIEQGRYLTVYQFVDRAVEALLHLEVRQLGDSQTDVARALEPVAGEEPPETDVLDACVRSPDAFPDPHSLAELGEADDAPGGWLWGQINSVLGIKHVARLLARAEQDRNWVPTLLQEAQEFVGARAVTFGQRMARIDEEQKHRRDERLSRSFPTDSEKSKDRFVSQYLGYIDRTGNPRGALAKLGLARLSGDRSRGEIQVTRPGFEFGNMHNPLFQPEADAPVHAALSKSEIAWYVQHVLEGVPCEADAIRTVCSFIEAGHDTSAALDQALKEARPKWSDAEVTTYKGGVLARMYQLGLISKTRDASRTVKYETTSAVHELSIL